MSDLAFRPRSIPEILDAAFGILRRHYGQFVVIAGCLYLPLIILQIATGAMGAGPGDAGAAAGLGALYLALLAAYVVWTPVAEAAMLVATSHAYRGEEVSARDALAFVLAHWRPIIGASLRKAARVFAWAIPLLVSVGLIGVSPMFALVAVPALFVFLIGGAMAYIRLFAIPATVVFEGLRGAEAMERARRLAEGERKKVFWTLVAVWMVYFAIFLAVQVPFTLVGGETVGQVAGSVLSIFIYPMAGITPALLYYDVRIRREGLDIELMAERLGGAPAGQPA
jgi:hypothetical protein